ncbi:MAG: RNA polymerase sigma factor [Acidobacteriaceae bacterium]|nr:RNA polymerase sigma factor [Acidobacteriaceae bacterium]
MRTIQLRSEATGTEDEAALIERARSGDSQALDSLVKRYLGDVYDIAYRVLGDRDVAQDAAQEAFVNAMRGLPRFRGESSFRTWLLRITVNCAHSLARKGVRRREISIVNDDDLVQEGADAATLTATRSELERASAALATLPEKQRLAVSLRIYQGLSYAEIAEMTGSTEGAARVNYHLGIKRLRELL